MSAFLWVEDFEGGQYREFAHALFGQALALQANAFPDEEIGLRALLRKHQITLATNYAEAARLIGERINDFDFVVLDIDLILMGEDRDKDMPIVQPPLERWYGYKPEADDEEASYNEARTKMKKVAGYHLFLDLVLKHGFPGNRILFCSNHGDQLKVSIDDSFEKARIETPDIWKKHDARVKDWIDRKRVDPYFRLRRWVTSACEELLEGLKFGQTHYKMPALPGAGALTLVNAEILLENLPRLIPAYETSERERQLAFRLFVRTLTQDWDKVNFKDKSLRPWEASFAAVLVHARNWTSHDVNALSLLHEEDVVLLFLIAIRMCFDLPTTKLENFEVALFTILGPEAELNMNGLKQDYECTYEEMKTKYAQQQQQLKDKEHKGYFSNMVNDLQTLHCIPPEEQAKRLLQILWHHLHWQGKNGGGFSPQPSHFNKSPFLDQLTRRIYAKSF